MLDGGGGSGDSGTSGGYSNGTAATAADVADAQAMLDQANNDKAQAEKVKNKSMRDLIIDAGVGFLLSFFGITDIWNCISKGDVGACASALLGLLPIGKMFTFGKAITKGISKTVSA